MGAEVVMVILLVGTLKRFRRHSSRRYAGYAEKDIQLGEDFY